MQRIERGEKELREGDRKKSLESKTGERERDERGEKELRAGEGERKKKN